MRVIKINSDNRVIEVKNVKDDYILEENEMTSDIGKIGQVMQSDGTFITPEPEEIPIVATVEEQILAETIYQTALLEMQMLGGSV